MRRRHVVFGVFATLLVGALAGGCAAPVGGQASDSQPRVIGSLAGTGVDRGSATTVAPPTRRKAAPRHTRAKKHRSAPPVTSSVAPPPAAPTTPPPTTPPASHPAPKHSTAPTKPTHSSSPVASLPEFAMCLSFYQLAREPNAAFRQLPRHASLSSRARVGRSYTSTYRQMSRVLQHAGLPRQDVVRVRGVAVMRAMDAIARALPSGHAVSNRALRQALVELSRVCSR